MERFLFHHVGVEDRDLQTAIPVYKDLFGYDLISGPFDDPIQGVSVCFLRRGEGDPVLELVAPLGSNSPILRALKSGGGTYHICDKVPDIKVAINHLVEKDPSS